MRSRAIALAAALAAGCTSTPQGEPASLRGPTAVVPFVGRTNLRPGVLAPYLAVANGRGDELRIFDPSTDKAAMSPGHGFPLSVPTVPGVPSPRYLAAASLSDGEADLLMVAGVGTVVQLVATWEDGGPSQPGISGAQSYDLSALAGTGAEILSLAAAPAVGPPSGNPPAAPAVPGRARLFAGFSGSSDGLGGKLVVVDMVRSPDGRAIEIADAQVQPLGFAPVSLALAQDGFHLYLATPEVITDFSTFPPVAGARQVLGVAEVDASAGAPGAWPVRGLDARAPTSLVAAATLGERWQGDPERFSAPVPRVYAALDPSGCGFDQPIACGVVTLDPATGALAPDPAPDGPIVPRQPFQAPYVLPALPLTLAVALPAASGAQQCLEPSVCDVNKPVAPSVADPNPVQPVKQPLMLLAPTSGQRWTTAAAVVGAADAKDYVLDLGRYSMPNQLTQLLPQPSGADNQRLRVTSVQSLPSDVPVSLGLWLQHPLSSQVEGLTATPLDMARAIVVTPGFTATETWSIAWQGILPGLVAKDCQLGLLPDGNLFLALQAPQGTGWAPGPLVGDPRYGIHDADTWGEGDLAIFGFAGDSCELPPVNGYPTPHEATITSILAPAPEYPGGAFRLVVPAPGDPDPFNLGCLASAIAGGTFAGTDGRASIRASGLVLAGSATGYAGRPPLLTEADVQAGTPEAKRFNLAWAEESALSGEALLLARKARRFYYPALPRCDPPPAKCSLYEGGYPELWDPLAPGPVLGFIVGPLCFDYPSAGVDSVCPPERLPLLLRDSTITFNTFSGLAGMFRQSVPSGLSTSAAAFDKSQFGSGELGAVWYVTHQNDAMLMLAPGSFATVSHTLR